MKHFILNIILSPYYLYLSFKGICPKCGTQMVLNGWGAEKDYCPNGCDEGFRIDSH